MVVVTKYKEAPIYFLNIFSWIGMTPIWPIYGDLLRSNFFWDVASAKEPDCVKKGFNIGDLPKCVKWAISKKEILRFEI